MYQSSDEIQSDKLGIIKNWLEDNQRTLVLVVGIILIALISFGLGRLTAVPKSQKPVIIETGNLSSAKTTEGQAGMVGQNQTASVGAALSGTASSAVPVIQKEIQGQPQNGQGIIVASKSGTKYHWPWCSWAKKIKPENQVWFNSEAEAQKAGYTACSAFQKLAPAGYKP